MIMLWLHVVQLAVAALGEGTRYICPSTNISTQNNNNDNKVLKLDQIWQFQHKDGKYFRTLHAILYRHLERPYGYTYIVHCKNSGVKLTPAGVNTGPISNDVTGGVEFNTGDFAVWKCSDWAQIWQNDPDNTQNSWTSAIVQSFELRPTFEAIRDKI